MRLSRPTRRQTQTAGVRQSRPTVRGRVDTCGRGRRGRGSRSERPTMCSRELRMLGNFLAPGGQEIAAVSSRRRRTRFQPASQQPPRGDFQRQGCSQQFWDRLEADPIVQTVQTVQTVPTVQTLQECLQEQYPTTDNLDWAEEMMRVEEETRGEEELVEESNRGVDDAEPRGIKPLQVPVPAQCEPPRSPAPPQSPQLPGSQFPSQQWRTSEWTLRLIPAPQSPVQYKAPQPVSHSA